MVDKSGYYLTAWHVLVDLGQPEPTPSKIPTYIYNWRTGEAQVTRGLAFFGDNTDIAIVYAPTDEQRKTAPGIEIKPTSLEKECQIWLFGVYLKDDIKTAVLGSVTGGVDAPANYGDPYWTNLIRIRGAIPFGGLSGGPAVNWEGKIVGIESGFYYSETRMNERQYYLGSTIEPIHTLLGPPKFYDYNIK